MCYLHLADSVLYNLFHRTELGNAKCLVWEWDAPDENSSLAGVV